MLRKIVEEINQVLANDNCLLTSTLRRLNKAIIERLNENKNSEIDLKIYINCIDSVNLNITYLIKSALILNLNGVDMMYFVNYVDKYDLIDLDSNLFEINYSTYLINKNEDGLS